VKPKLLVLDGKPFLHTDTETVHVRGEPVEVLNGLRPELDASRGTVALRAVQGVRPEATHQPTTAEALAALAGAMFADRGELELPTS
jgi:hypothetical protein